MLTVQDVQKKVLELNQMADLLACTYRANEFLKVQYYNGLKERVALKKRIKELENDRL